MSDDFGKKVNDAKDKAKEALGVGAEKASAAKDKVHEKIKGLAFRSMVEKKVSAETRTKFPVLDKLIPLTNYIACGFVVLVVIVIVACTRGGGGSSGSSSSGSAAASGGSQQAAQAGQSSASSSQASGVSFTAAKESDFSVSLASDGSAIITKYNGSGGNIAIPATIQGVQVTQIGDSAFEVKRDITGVQLPEGLKVIGKSAFEHCSNLRTIIIPNTVTEIRDSAFYSCGRLESINIPDSVTVFGEMIFQISGLKSFTFPAGLIALKEIKGDSVRDGMFSQSKLENIVIPEGIETIGDRTFFDCKNLISVTLPSTIKAINTAAFFGCTNVTEVIIPESVTSIRFGNEVFGSYGTPSKLNLVSQAALRRVGWDGN